MVLKGKIIGRLWSEIHQSFFVVVGASGIIIGAILALVFRVNYFSSPVWIVLVFILFIIAFFKPKVAFLLIALVAGMIVMFFRVANELIDADYVRQLYGQTVLISGVIEGDPEIDEAKVKFRLNNLEFGEEKIKKAGSIYITGGKSTDLKRDDKVIVEGKLSEGFGVYVGYMYLPEIRDWGRPSPGNYILEIRDWFSERVSSLIPEKESKLGLAYLLGNKTGLDDRLSEELRMVGLVHIVVASGAHLSIIVEIMKKIFGKISRFSGLLFSILFILFFMTIVGWTPSILRAGTMSILMLIFWYSGRKVEPWRIILIVAAFTLIINPMYIINLGWLLSFASFSGIMVLGPILIKFFYGNRRMGFIAQIIITTIAATLMTLPITLYYYGQFSLISVFANLLILPTLSYAMGLVFLTGLVYGISFIDMVASFLTTKLLDYHILVVNLFSSMEQLLIKIDKYNAWVFLLYIPVTIIIVIAAIMRRRKLKRRFYVIIKGNDPSEMTFVG